MLASVYRPVKWASDALAVALPSGSLVNACTRRGGHIEVPFPVIPGGGVGGGELWGWQAGGPSELASQRPFILAARRRALAGAGVLLYPESPWALV